MQKPDPLVPLSEAQIEIMNVVWDRGEVTVADVWRTLAARRKVARNTVLTMITRLEEKGWLNRDDAGHAFRYRAAVPRKATLRSVVRRLVDTAFGGSAEGMVMALSRARSFQGGGGANPGHDRPRGEEEGMNVLTRLSIGETWTLLALSVLLQVDRHDMRGRVGRAGSPRPSCGRPARALAGHSDLDPD